MLVKGISNTKDNREFLNLINPNYKSSTGKGSD